MRVRHNTLYLMVNVAVAAASAIQLIRGIRLGIVVVAAVVFLVVGNATVYLAGSKRRALDRQQKRKYYAGLE